MSQQQEATFLPISADRLLCSAYLTVALLYVPDCSCASRTAKHRMLIRSVLPTTRCNESGWTFLLYVYIRQWHLVPLPLHFTRSVPLVARNRTCSKSGDNVIYTVFHVFTYVAVCMLVYYRMGFETVWPGIVLTFRKKVLLPTSSWLTLAFEGE